MAYLEDQLSEDEKQQQATAPVEASGPGVSYSPASTSGATTAAKQDSSAGSMAPIAQYFAANEDQGAQMASNLGNSVTDAGKQAAVDWDPTEAADAQQQAENLGSQSGIASNLSDMYQDPTYTQGMGSLDAYVTTRGSGGKFGAIQDTFNGLDWNKVGSVQKPTKPETTSLTSPEEPYLNSSYEGSKFGGTPWMTHWIENQHPIRYSDSGLDMDAYNQAYGKWLTDQEAYQKAQAEQQAALEQYAVDRSTYDDARNPFLAAFGLPEEGIDTHLIW